MNARVFLHPTVTLADVHRLYREHQLVAVSRPVAASHANQRRVELVRMAPRPWAAPGRQVLR